MEKIIFSAPGRTEIGGNHTDHQHGCVVAGAVNLNTVAEVQRKEGDEIRIHSEGYAPFSIHIHDLAMREEEQNTTLALVRGVAAAFADRGAKLSGFDARIRSSVLPGSGLSSSAAFEVLIGTILNTLFFEEKLSPVEIAQIGQWAENTYFGKPCGLMDQTASAVGGMVFIDFADPSSPVVEKIDFDFDACGYALCIIDSGADHADLTDEYASIPADMKAVARCFGKEVLREVDEAAFWADLARVRREVGDRAALRAIHFFEENARVRHMAQALRNNDFAAFLSLVNESGASSWKRLQNITPTGATVHQDIALALTLAEKLLNGQGAVRIHGGGFAGTIQAFVPKAMLANFKAGMEAVLGEGRCHVLSIRPEGGIRVR